MIYRSSTLVVFIRSTGKNVATLGACKPNGAGSCGRPFQTAKVTAAEVRALTVPVWNHGPMKHRKAYVFECTERILPLLRKAFPSLTFDARNVCGLTPKERTASRNRKQAERGSEPSEGRRARDG